MTGMLELKWGNVLYFVGNLVQRNGSKYDDCRVEESLKSNRLDLVSGYCYPDAVLQFILVDISILSTCSMIGHKPELMKSDSRDVLKC